MPLSLDQLMAASVGGLREASLRPVRTAVLDTGIDATHPDLTARVDEAHMSEIEPQPGVRQIPPGANDLFGHGTGVAGVLARTAPNARLVDIRVLDAKNRGDSAGIVAGMRAAIEAGAKIINMSLALSERDTAALLPVLERAYRNNVIIVAAQKNIPIGDDGLPAQLALCIGVGNSETIAEDKWSFTRDTIEFSAQGNNILTTAMGGGYTRVTGTSFATPFISGICALAAGVMPDITPFEMKAALKYWAGSC